MIDQNTATEGDQTNDDDLAAIYGEAQESSVDLDSLEKSKKGFAPWHHPIKQVVRNYQWAALTKRLIDAREPKQNILRYFTLPGPDLLDVRVLADVCAPHGIRVEYFGFDAAIAQSAEPTAQSNAAARTAAIMAEAVLRQADRITAEAVILPDRLEDIAHAGSQAAAQLSQRLPFDIINIDACDHLAYCPEGRSYSTFNALQALLRHQALARLPWLLFVTTRASPELLGEAGENFQQAIAANLALEDSGFGEILAACLDVDSAELGNALHQTWAASDKKFLKLYSIGLGKYLLQYFHNQPSLPANVELASAYAYRVHSTEPDMLALAFRITPDAMRHFPPSPIGNVSFPALEPARASKVVKRAEKLQDLDQELLTDEVVRLSAIEGTVALLKSAQYDINGWKDWLSKHSTRPMVV